MSGRRLWGWAVLWGVLWAWLTLSAPRCGYPGGTVFEPRLCCRRRGHWGPHW